MAANSVKVTVDAPEEEEDALSVAEKRRLVQAAAEVDASAAAFRAALEAQMQAEGIKASPTPRPRAKSNLPPRDAYLRQGMSTAPLVPDGHVKDAKDIIDGHDAILAQIREFGEATAVIGAAAIETGEPTIARGRANTLPSRNIYARNVTPNDAEVAEKAKLAAAVEDVNSEVEAFKRMLAAERQQPDGGANM
eukprot:a179958_101.p1 GENE.a179958_101~~a179958_101.p1  ORF type:complete len:205 (-),score=57.33 a179958_101:110-688(-)